MLWSIVYKGDGRSTSSSVVPARDANSAYEAFSAARDIFGHPDFELFLAAHDRYLKTHQSFEESNLIGPALPLSNSATKELLLDVHAVLGTVTVLIEGPSKTWTTRVKNGQEFSQRFSSAKRAEKKRNAAFHLLLKVRNYSQHEGQVPIVLQQKAYEQGAFIALHSEVKFPRAAMKGWEQPLRDCLTELQNDFALLLMEGYKSLDYLDSLNRELLLEVFAERASIARDLVSLADQDDRGMSAFLVADSADQLPVRIPTLREQDLLESLAALPADFPIRFPRPNGPGQWIQGPQPASGRPLLAEAPYKPGPGEAPWWATDLARARRELGTTDRV